MKIRMKTIVKYISILLLLVIVPGILGSKEAYGAGKKAGTELLIVIDNSGSMNKEIDFLEEMVETIEQLAKNYEEDITLSYLIFNENAQIAETREKVQMVSKKETCIMQGIETADQWMEKEIKEGNIVKVLFVSDLFSSRYLENGQVKKYDMNYAREEQEKIQDIELRWKEWCDAKKANILIWTWESFCVTERKENTVDYLQKNNPDEISMGYQVKFEPVKNILINHEDMKAENKSTEFVKLTVQAFEILSSSSDLAWEEYKVNNEKARTIEVGEETKRIYLYFSGAKDVQVKYKDEELKVSHDGLYILDQKEDAYYIKALSDSDKIIGYRLIVPDLEWKIGFLDEPIKRNESFKVILEPSMPLGVNGKELEEHCTLKILKEKEEICTCSMSYDAEKGCFYTECNLDAGVYKFIAIVNEKEVVKKGKSVN